MFEFLFCNETESVLNGRTLLLTADATIDEIVRSQITHQASIPLSRQPLQRHILEVSAAQQRQQDVLLQARKHVRAPALHFCFNARKSFYNLREFQNRFISIFCAVAHLDLKYDKKFKILEI
jgi:hypothetical protein